MTVFHLLVLEVGSMAQIKPSFGRQTGRQAGREEHSDTRQKDRRRD